MMASFLWGTRLRQGDKLVNAFSASAGGYEDAQRLWLLIKICHVSAFVLLLSLGAFVGGHVADRYGRRYCLLASFGPVSLGALFGLGAAFMSSRCLMLLCLFDHRVLVGFGCGLTIGVSSMYLSEVAPPLHRGPVMALHPLFITLGILTAQVLGTQTFFGTYDGFAPGVNDSLVACHALGLRQLSHTQAPLATHSTPDAGAVQCDQLASWRWGAVLAFPLVPAALGVLLLLLGAESPAFMLHSRGDEEALVLLNRLRSSSEKARLEIAELHGEVEASRSEKRGKVPIRELFDARYRKAVVLAIRLQVD